MKTYIIEVTKLDGDTANINRTYAKCIKKAKEIHDFAMGYMGKETPNGKVINVKMSVKP